MNVELRGKRLVLTGLSDDTSLRASAEDAGAILVEEVSRSPDYVVVLGTLRNRKYAEAIARGVPVLGPEDLHQWLEDGVRHEDDTPPSADFDTITPCTASTRSCSAHAASP